MSSNNPSDVDQSELPGSPKEGSGKPRKRKPTRKQMRPDGACEGPGCSNIVPGGLVGKGHKHYFCSARCRRKYHASRKPTRKQMRPDGVCEGPGCSNIVPGGLVRKGHKHYFCSARCGRQYAATMYEMGTCEYCNEPVRGSGAESRNPRFCKRECFRQFHEERLIEPTGPFRSVLKEYLEVNNFYRNMGKRQPRHHLSMFLRYAVQEEQIVRLEDVRPSVVTRFVAHEVERGITSLRTIGYVWRFFEWLITEERVDMSNPVRSSIHSPKRPPHQPRPYSDKEVAALRKHLQNEGDASLLLAFEIGVECGLRIGEVANIRISDVDTEHQKIHVRLPTKNQRTRDVPYHDKVAAGLEAWWKERASDSRHDHLLHTKEHKVAYSQARLDVRFRQVFSIDSELTGTFRFHRLRHTWATRLMNNGMELATLKELGGWASWNGMQGYIRVLPETIRRQYEDAYTKLQGKLESGTEETLSLLEFAQLSTTAKTSPMASAA